MTPKILNTRGSRMSPEIPPEQTALGDEILRHYADDIGPALEIIEWLQCDTIATGIGDDFDRVVTALRDVVGDIARPANRFIDAGAVIAQVADFSVESAIDLRDVARSLSREMMDATTEADARRYVSLFVFCCFVISYGMPGAELYDRVVLPRLRQDPAILAHIRNHLAEATGRMRELH